MWDDDDDDNIEVLVSVDLGDGTRGGLVRAGQWVSLTSDIRSRGGAIVEDDPICWTDAGGGRVLLGGRLPPGSATAVAVDIHGRDVPAATDDGWWAAVVALDGDIAAAVRFEDADGGLVRPPLPADWSRLPVTDTDVPCPACGATDWEEITASDGSRGMSGTAEDDMSPTPFVACVRCGHEANSGAVFYGVGLEEGDEQWVPDAAWLAEVQADRRRDERKMLGSVKDLPIYVPEGLEPLALESWGGSEGRAPRNVSVRYPAHDDDLTADTMQPSWLTVETERGRPDLGDDYEASRQRETLASLESAHSWPTSLSEAALRLWMAARDREAARRIAGSAATTRRAIRVDGLPQRFLVTTSGSRWVATGRAGNLTLRIAADGIAPDEVHLRALAHPLLLAPEPDDDLPAERYRPQREVRDPFDTAIIADLASGTALADLAYTLTHVARRSLRVVADPDTWPEDLGTSRIGGAPDVAPGFTWPRLGGRPHMFVAQLRLADLDPAVWPGPRDGLLGIYACLEADGMYVDVKDAAALIVTPPGVPLRRARFPDDLDQDLRLEHTAITFVAELHLPEASARVLDKHGIHYDDPRHDALYELSTRLADEYDHRRAIARVLGWPRSVQNDALDDLAWLGTDGDSEEANPKDWSLLFEYDLQGPALYIGLPTADLAAGRLDRVQAITQHD